QLPYTNEQQTPVDLQEIAVWIWNNAFYFYGKSPHIWKYNIDNKQFEHHRHIYSNKTFYFISNKAGTGKKIMAAEPPQGIVNSEVFSFDDYLIHESDSLNLIRSGRIWYGEHFDAQTTYQFLFSANNIITSDKAGVKVATVARSSANFADNILKVDVDKQIDFMVLQHLPVDYSSTNNYATKQSVFANFYPVGDTVKIVLSYNKPDSYSSAWLDYIILQFRRELKISSGVFFFRDVESTEIGKVSRFHLEYLSTDMKIWDISDHQNAKEIEYSARGAECEFTAQTDSLREFVAFDPESNEIVKPEMIGLVENQNLRASTSCDMLIVTAEEYIIQAKELADFHRSEGLEVKVTVPQKIYNEFSSGASDVTAIRNYIRHLYFSAIDSTNLRYVLLFGDGSYDTRPGYFDMQKLLPGYQSENSLLPTESFITDDFFGLLDTNEGGSTGLLDIGIGRLPVSSVNEAAIVVEKIIAYRNNHWQGNWQQDLLFIADNGNYNMHSDQAENLTGYIDTAYSQFNIRKIYSDAYPFEINTTNLLAKEEINRSIEQGQLIVNYTGHGSELGLGSDNIININDIVTWKNSDRLTVFMTATCEFARFDDSRRTSAGELILLNPTGGGVALFTTTRLVFSTPNFILNKNFYKYIFERNEQGYCFGDVMMNTKIASGQGINKRNFTLLGDPATKLAKPRNIISIKEINHRAIENLSDTFIALSKLNVSGQIFSDEGLFLNNYIGELEARIYDQAIKIQTLGENESFVTTFDQYENILFRGKASINNGEWEISFILPTDISQAVGNGRMSFFSVDIKDISNNAGGYFSDFLITGGKQADMNDAEGPDIQLFINNQDFLNGDKVEPESRLIVLLNDSSGINTTGFAIGRNITAWIDTKDAEPINLNSYYQAKINSYQSGSVEFEIGPLSEGIHSIYVKAWDIANNQSEEKIDFEVSTIVVPEIQRVFNYPNPFAKNTSFYFSHNLMGIKLDVCIDIYTVSGKIVKHLESSMICDNKLSDPIFWDGLDDFGNKLGRSVYFYRLKIITEQGFVVEKIEKLVSLK
ncbi:MAG: type IX secretion system sortase PorU, partial [Bacteroidota bacterium]|nr:type IX secretion system sortase PorU [Bacteroidota bacterium]